MIDRARLRLIRAVEEAELDHETRVRQLAAAVVLLEAKRAALAAYVAMVAGASFSAG